MIKVCMITTVHHPFDVRIFYKEARSLVREGCNVTLIAQHDKEETVDGVKIINLQRPRNRFGRMTKTVWSAFRKALKTNADVYHLHDPELATIAFLLKLRGKIVIYDMHENLPKQIKDKQWVNPNVRQLLSSTVRFAERILLHKTPIVFAEHSYRKNYLWVKECTTVLNMPLMNELLSIKPDASEKFGFAIGYIGGVTAERGSLTIIEALKILKENGLVPRFECIGPIDNYHKNELFKKCEEYDLHNVVFHGYFPAYKGWHIIARCSIGLALLHPIPNYYESYPTKVFEYMIMGLPVITSNFPLYRSIVENNNCGFCVDPLDPKAIADAIRWMYEHPNDAATMGRLGKQAIKDKFNWENEIKKLMTFYEEILTAKANIKKINQ